MKSAPSTDRIHSAATLFRSYAERVEKAEIDIYDIPHNLFNRVLDAIGEHPGFLSDLRRLEQATLLCFMAAMVESGDA